MRAPGRNAGGGSSGRSTTPRWTVARGMPLSVIARWHLRSGVPMLPELGEWIADRLEGNRRRPPKPGRNRETVRDKVIASTVQALVDHAITSPSSPSAPPGAAGGTTSPIASSCGVDRPSARGCSTPTLRGRSRRSESTSRGCTSVGPAAAPLACALRTTNCPAMRWASCSTACGQSATQGRLAGQDVVDASAQLRPLRVGDVEVAPEIEQGALPHGVSDALGVHQAMGEVGFAVLGPPGLGAPNEHDAHDSGRAAPESTHSVKLWHYIEYHQNPFL